MNETVAVSSVKLPAEMAYLEPLTSFVAGVCRLAGCDDEDASMVILAVEEGVSNVIHHAYAQDEKGHFEVSFEVSKAAITVDIHDMGMPFDTEVLNQDDDVSGKSRRVLDHGLGIVLMKGVMDRVEFRNLGKAGKSVRMMRHFRHRKVDRLSPENEPATQVSKGGSTQGPYSIRLMEPHEAFEVSRCAFQTYGYSYREFIYYPEKLRELNEKRLMKSFVALDASGAVVGHLALSWLEADSPVAEMVAAFVIPSCRQRGILKRLNEAVMAEAKQAGLHGLFVHAVTDHVVSQKGALSSGFAPNGVLVSAIPGDSDFKGLSGKARERHCAVLLFRRLSRRTRHDLWVPFAYVPLLEAILSWSGEDVVLHTEGRALPAVCGGRNAGNGACKVADFNVAEVRIADFGLDSLSEVQKSTRIFLGQKVDAIYLYLDAEVPECTSFCEACREMGYVFCGYLPEGIGGHDALILQYGLVTTLDAERVSLADDRIRSIFAAVVQEIGGIGVGPS